MDVFRGLYPALPGRSATYFRWNLGKKIGGFPEPSELSAIVLQPVDYLKLPGNEYREAQKEIAEKGRKLALDQIEERDSVRPMEPWMKQKAIDIINSNIDQALRLGII